MSKRGIDVSEHQQTIDFTRVKTAVDFVILREGLRKRADYNFVEYAKGARSAGLPILGVYHFIYVDTAAVRENAESTVRNLKAAGFDPAETWIFADLEYHTYEIMNRKPDKASATAWTKEYLDTLKALGCKKLGIYTNNDFYVNYYDWDVLSEWKDKLWLADYTGGPDRPCIIQQTGDKGSVDGINDSVDTDILHDDTIYQSIYPELTSGELKDMTHYISNSGSDEYGGAHGGKAGDQTGREWQLRAWYNRPWSCVLRHPEAKVRGLLADLAVKAAKNDLIGYDQYQRDTYWQQLQAVGYDPSKITVPCESDCSAGVIANTKAVGYLLGIKALQTVASSYTGNMRTGFRAAGFQVLTESKYLTSPDYLLPGDILLNDAHHTCTNVTKGSKAVENIPAPYEPVIAPDLAVTGPMTTVSYGSTGSAVKTLQAALTALGYTLEIDGEFGYDSHFKVKLFQTEQGLVSDGIVGSLTWSKIYGLLTVKVWSLSKTPLWVGSVTASSLNVRSYASSLFGQVSAWPVLGQGNQIDVCDELTGPQGDRWLYVRIAGGVFGFVSEKYVKRQ